jgi:hypothetical protein
MSTLYKEFINTHTLYKEFINTHTLYKKFINTSLRLRLRLLYGFFYGTDFMDLYGTDFMEQTLWINFMDLYGSTLWINFMESYGFYNDLYYLIKLIRNLIYTIDLA